jgi:hypothetical protein
MRIVSRGQQPSGLLPVRDSADRVSEVRPGIRIRAHHEASVPGIESEREAHGLVRERPVLEDLDRRKGLRVERKIEGRMEDGPDPVEAESDVA